MNFPAIDPIAFTIGPLAVRWYSLSYIIGILIGLILINIKIEKYLNKKGYVTREDFHALEDRVNKLSLEIKSSKAKIKK